MNDQPKVTKINFDRVIGAYSGRPGCACGCRGKHVVTTHGVDKSTKINGYAPDPEDISDRSVKAIIRNMLATGQARLEDDHVWAETPTRLYIVNLA